MDETDEIDVEYEGPLNLARTSNAALEQALQGSKDRITKLLTNKVPEMRDISVGIADAMTGRGSYGLTLNKMRAARISEEGQFYGLLSKEADALERGAYRREMLKLRSSGSGADTTSAIKNYGQREELVTKYGENSPQVNRFDNYVRAMQTANLGDRVAVLNPSTPGTPAATLPKGVPPQDQPKLRGEQKQATEEAELDVKRQEKFAKARSGLVGFEQQSEMVTGTIDKALDLATKSWTATGYGNVLGVLPETDARALNNYLATIQANVGFDKLQQMREASPTGGALGQISDFENRLLQAVQGALDPKQKDQLIENLTTIRSLYPKVLAERRRAFATDYANMLKAPAAANNPPAGADQPSPAGVDPAIWGAMTPEERALWK